MRARRSTALALALVTVLVAGACGSKPSSRNINTPPTAVLLAAPVEGTPPLLVDFSAVLSSDAGGEIVGYHWDLGDGTISTLDEFSHTYSAEGAYTVTLTVTDNKGGVDTETVQVVVNTPPTVTAGADVTSGTTPLPVNFTSTPADPGGTVASVVWDFGDGATASGANAAHTYFAAGTYDATVTVTDDLGGTATDVVTVAVTGNAGPVADATSDVTSGKTPLVVTFDGSGSTDDDDGIASWDWDFGDGNGATGPTPAPHTYTTAGSYLATLTVTDVLGATDTATIAITVADNVAPTASGRAATAFPKPGVPVSFDGTASVDPDGTIVSWDWDFGDAAVGSGPTPTHTYAALGSYPVELTVTDDNGATDTATFVVTLAANVAPNAVASVTTAKPKTGFPVAFKGSSSNDPDGSIAAYDWNFGDGGVGTGATPTHSYATAGVYTATLTVTDDNGATDVATVEVTVVDNVVPVAAITATPTSGTAPLAVAFNGAGSVDPDGSIVSYSWNFGDSTSSTVTSPNHTFTAAGTYNVVLTVTDDNGVTDTESVVITVNP